MFFSSVGTVVDWPDSAFNRPGTRIYEIYKAFIESYNEMNNELFKPLTQPRHKSD